MPAKRDGPTLRQVATQVLDAATTPMTVDEYVRRVLELYPSPNKNAPKTLRTELHSSDRLGVELVFLDPATIVPLHVAMQGVCFRVMLEAEEIDTGHVSIRDNFFPFLVNRFQRLLDPGAGEGDGKIELHTENDQPIPCRIVTASAQWEVFQGQAQTETFEAFDLNDWLHAHDAHEGDSLRVTILNWRPAHLRIEFEAQTVYRQDAFAAWDSAFANCIQTLLDESYDERIYTHPAALTAYARLRDAFDYPGHDWREVLFKDPRFLVMPMDIRASEGISTQDYFSDLFTEPEVPEHSFSREQGDMVYRFSAASRYNRQKHVVEILGRQTLADFDGIMRDAFDLESFDHLSEFTLIKSRGKGKRPYKQQYGEINPFEATPAMKRRVAGLGLEAGGKLEYLYDFGDNLEHTLVLESIHPAEKGVKYPRNVK